MELLAEAIYLYGLVAALVGFGGGYMWGWCRGWKKCAEIIELTTETWRARALRSEESADILFKALAERDVTRDS